MDLRVHAKSLCLASLALVCVEANALTEFRWTNGLGTGLWNAPGNWSDSAVPNGADAKVVFPGSTAVTLDTGTETLFGALQISGNQQVSITATEGSALKPKNGTLGEGSNGVTISSGATLALHAPIVSDVRFDKWGVGTLECDSRISSTATGYPLIFSAGTNVFSGSAEISAPNGTIGFGNAGDGVYSPTFLRDRVKLNAKDVHMAVGGWCAACEVIQEGSEVEVSVDGSLVLNDKGINHVQRWTLVDGKQTIKDVVVGAKTDGNGSGVLAIKGGTFSSGRIEVRCGMFRQTGGEAVVAGDVVSSNVLGQIEVAGGRLEVQGRLVTKDALIEQTGGEIVTTNVTLAGNGVFRLSGGQLTLGADAESPLFTSAFQMCGGVVSLQGGCAIGRNQQVQGGGIVIAGSGNLLTVGRNAEISCSRRYEPFAITMKTGNSLKLNSISSRITAPLYLTLESGAKIAMPKSGEPYVRNVLVAHRLTVGGVEMAKGRYSGGLGWFDALGAASVVVPYVWTGTAGDGRWQTPGNWDGNVVPPNGATTCVDLSHASGETVTLDENVTVSCLVMNGVSGSRKLTVAGAGTLTIDVPAVAVGGLMVGPGREIIFDVDLLVGDHWPAFLGGGRITVKKGFPNSIDYMTPRVALDATLAFAGTTATANGLSFYTHEAEGCGRVVFEEGANVVTHHMVAGKNGFYGVAEFEQSGGAVTLNGGLYVTYSNGKVIDPERYTLCAGTLTVGTGVFLGNYLSGYWSDRRAGGDFYLEGGTLVTPKLVMEKNNNHYHLVTGTVRLGAGGFAYEHDDRNLKSRVPNSDHVYLYEPSICSTAPWASDLNMIFKAAGRPTVFDITGGSATLNAELSGDGDIRKIGANALILNGTNTLTGRIEVMAGTLTLGAHAKIAGSPTFVFAEGASISLLGEVSPTTALVVSQASDVYVPADTTITVRRFLVGGVEQAAGSHAVNGGTIVVAPQTSDDFVWTGGATGDWSAAANWTAKGVPQTASDAVDFGQSCLASETAIRLDTDISLAKLSYSHPQAGASLTIGAGGVLMFPDNAEIHVPAGNTLVFDCEIHAAGYLYKKGTGKVVFRGKVRSVTPPESLTSDTSFLYVSEGEAEVQGELAGLRLWVDAAGVLPNAPRAVIGAGAVLTNRTSVNIAWKGEEPRSGEVVQNGGRVDLSITTPNFEKVKCWAWGFTKGGRIQYTLNDGYFAMSASPWGNQMCWNRGYAQTFRFVQNGGEAVFRDFYMGDGAGSDHLFELNGGVLRLAGPFLTRADSSGQARIALNGGVVRLDFSGGEVIPSVYETMLGGVSVWEETDASKSYYLSSRVGGEGVIVHRGEGLLDFRAPVGIDGGIEVEAGRLALSAETSATNFVVRGGSLEFVNVSAADIPETSVVSIDRGAELRLADTGEIVVRRLYLGGQSRAAGVYGATAPRGGDYFTGNGTLRVLEGTEAGTIIIVR